MREPYDIFRLVKIYDASDGEATARLYSTLEGLGPVGVVAVNLFRASKASGRAKVYRGGVPGRGSYRSLAYSKKQWSLNNLCRVLSEHGDELGIRWGWKRDPDKQAHAWVLYVDLPTGQVSFHAAPRGQGPDYPGDWDGARGMSPARILSWIAKLMADAGVEAVHN